MNDTDPIGTLAPAAAADGKAIFRFLVFKLNGYSYGIPMDVVLEIVRARKIRAVPCTPAFIRGVINLRGKVVPVMDARRRLEMPPEEDGERTSIVIVQCRSQVVGLIVDEVRQVLTIQQDQIERPAPDAAGLQRFIAGFGVEADQVRILLDPERLLFDGWPRVTPSSEPAMQEAS